MSDKKRVTVTLKADHVKRLDDLAQSNRRSRAWVVRELITLAIGTLKEKKE